MRSNVVRLAEARADSEIIKGLQLVLHDAERGRVRGIVLASHYGGADFGFVGSGSLCRDPHLAVAAIHRLLQKFV